MDKFPPLPRQTIGVLFFSAGILLSIGACGILASHIGLFSQKRDTAVMIGTQLPELTSAVALLSANVEAEKLFASQALAAREEQASVYILPDGSPIPRTVKVLQEISRTIGHDDSFVLEKLTFDPASKDHGDYRTFIGHAVFRGSFQHTARMLAILGFGGDMMVRDVLSPEDQNTFLRLIESAAPTSLRRAEDFLYFDLMQYAAQPDRSEQRMVEDLPVSVASDVRAILLDAGLASVRSAFDGIASGLFEKGLWPMPLMNIRSLERSGDRWIVEFAVFGR